MAKDELGYEFSFEITRPYPISRKFIMKKPLQRGFMDGMMELIGGSKK